MFNNTTNCLLMNIYHAIGTVKIALKNNLNFIKPLVCARYFCDTRTGSPKQQNLFSHSFGGQQSAARSQQAHLLSEDSTIESVPCLSFSFWCSLYSLQLLDSNLCFHCHRAISPQCIYFFIGCSPLCTCLCPSKQNIGHIGLTLVAQIVKNLPVMQET